MRMPFYGAAHRARSTAYVPEPRLTDLPGREVPLPVREVARYGKSAMAPHVLVADDDAWILRMVSTVLEKRGYSVETALDGEDALQRALAHTPDLLITDVMMPRMDGWALVRRLRSHEGLALLPVIFLTALSSEDDRIRGFRLGA